jgi:hypothetical protein
MAKMSKDERKRTETLRDTLAQALSDCQAALKEDDEECAKAAADSDAAAIKAVADRGAGGTREQIARGVLAIRILGGRKGGPQ